MLAKPRTMKQWWTEPMLITVDFLTRKRHPSSWKTESPFSLRVAMTKDITKEHLCPGHAHTAPGSTPSQVLLKINLVFGQNQDNTSCQFCRLYFHLSL